jgi:hypothetical protein
MNSWLFYLMIVFNFLGHNPKYRGKNPATPTPQGLGPCPYTVIDSPPLDQDTLKAQEGTIANKRETK